jgi:hypothetical protein
LIGRQSVVFREIQYTVAQYGDIGLGVRKKSVEEAKNGGIVLNPSPDASFSDGQIDAVVVLTTYD